MRVTAKTTDATVAEVHIHGVIGDDWGGGITLQDVTEALAALPADVTTIEAHINSVGGDVFEGVAIANALRDQATKHGRRVVTVVDALAASAASVIAMAGSVVRMPENALMMIHEPMALVLGNAGEMRQMAETLDTVRDTSIVATYQWHSTLSADEIRALLVAETWLDADEAIAKGFATEKVEGLQAVAASLDRRVLGKLRVPERFAARVAALAAPTPAPVPTPVVTPVTGDVVIAACEQAGLDLAFARSIVAARVTPADLDARIRAEVTARKAEATRGAEIRALCTFGRVRPLADDLVASGASVATVRNIILTVTALMDQAIEIDGTLMPDGHLPRPVPSLNPRDIYKARNAGGQV